MTTTAAPLYIGTKTVHATPMTRAAYNDYRGWPLPADENGEDAGFLVEYVDGGKANDTRHVGYISWSPADVFERSYKPIGTFQDRVRAEHAELEDRLDKLTEFLATPVFESLPSAEQERLVRQAGAMVGYSDVLAERIAAFQPAPPPVDNAFVAPGAEQFGESSGPVSA